MKRVILGICVVVCGLGLLGVAPGCQKRTCDAIMDDIARLQPHDFGKAASLAQEAFSAGCVEIPTVPGL